MPPHDHARTPPAIRQSVLHRLRNRAAQLGVEPQRYRKHAIFERFLTRVLPSGDWIVKGGFALELRYAWACRPTIDIDLYSNVAIEEALVRLRETLAARASADEMSFEIDPLARALPGADGGGIRIGVIASVGGLELDRFHVDIGRVDASVQSPDIAQGSTSPSPFAGEPLAIPIYPVTQHLAEKLHAYTLPRDRPNSRVKDLVDVEDAFTLAARFWDRLLARRAGDSRWIPSSGSWERSSQ